MRITGSTKSDNEDFLRVNVIPVDGEAEHSVNIEGVAALQAHDDATRTITQAAQVGAEQVMAATGKRDTAVAELVTVFESVPRDDRERDAYENDVQAARAACEAEKAVANERFEAVKAAALEARDAVLSPLVSDSFARLKSRDDAAKPAQERQLAAEAAGAQIP